MSNFSNFIGLALVGKDIVLGFIIEYSSLRDFGPQVVGLFLYEDFWKMTFWLLVELEISYRVMISWSILVSFRGIFLKIMFLHGEMSEFSLLFFCIKDTF